MAAVGGDVFEITFNHPTLGSGTLFAKAGEDTTFDPGGFRSNDDANMIAGDGTMIDQMNRNRWSFEGTIAWDMNEALELQQMVALAGSPVLSDWTITHVNGSVYGGQGKPVGDLQGNGNAATFTLKIAGSGTLKKIVG